METNNLWGDIMPKYTSSPTKILEEQANFLSQITDNKLQGEIRTSPCSIFEKPFFAHITEDASKYITHSLFINAPSINYSFELLNVTHALLYLYPLVIRTPNSSAEIRCDDEKNFINELKSIMQNEDSRKMIQSLIIQSNQ